MKFPTVSGIIATDNIGNIANDGFPIGASMSPHLNQLDRQVLRSYLKQKVTASAKPIIVMGEQTFKDMGGLLSSLGSNPYYIVSNQSDVKVVGLHGNYPNMLVEHHTVTDPQCVLVAKAYQMAMKQGGNIIVLGGRSVYNAFARHYSHFVHVKFKGTLYEGQKQVIVTSKQLDNTPSLILDDLMVRAKWLDTSEVMITEYGEDNG